MGQVVYVSLGSNQGDRFANLSAAVASIEQEVGGIEKISRICQTPPWGFEAELDFYNLCIQLTTSIGPIDLLEKFQTIEEKLGRTQKTTSGYSSRKIDIDILSIDALIICSPQLTLPHPHLHERRFVLEPLLEIAPDFVHPSFKKSISELINQCKDQTELTILAQKIYTNC